MNKLAWAFIIIFAALLPHPSAQALELTGYYKNELVVLQSRKGDGLAASINRLRLKIDHELAENIYVRVEPKYAFLIKSEEVPLLSDMELDRVVFDRAFVKASLPAADITAGKQRIAWGTGHIWNPTDIFNPFAFSFAVAEEERAGIDAVRVEVPLGDLSGIEGVIITDKEFSSLEKSKKGLKAKTNVGMWDISASYVSLGERGYQFGFDSSGEFFELGVRSEAVLVNRGVGEDAAIKASLGWGYTLEDGTGIDMEYFYNGEGSKNRADYDWAGLFSGNVSQLATDYYFFGINNLIDEITSVRCSFILNACDMSYIFYPSYQKNIHQNVDLWLEAMIAGGAPGSEFKPSDAQGPSGFMGSNMAFARFKFSF